MGKFHNSYIWAVPSFLAVQFASFLVKLWLFKTQGYDKSHSIIAQIRIATILLMKFL
jgi:HEPN domain-containing protein